MSSEERRRSLDELQAFFRRGTMTRRAEDLLRRLKCANCGLFSDEEARGWRTYLTDDEPLVAEHFCPDCAQEEFGDA